ncbi:glycosyltransferase family 39 protein [Candidatus Gottesmanbacteria bacterium]|nr:glycosyltransferase family 39 protein [Candidatus Gottesmanbacteria bacterium]
MARPRGVGFAVLLIVLFTLGYLATRLTNLTQLPVFTDEAIYIRWSQIGAQDANWRFISLVDGKQPLFTWVVMVLMRLVPGDPLFVGRLASVFAGAASMVGIWFLAFELFKSKKAAFLSSFLYLISPFALVYDRMALYDSLVATFFLWNLYLAIRLARSPRLDTALLLGLTLGAGMLNKTSGFLSLYLIPTTLFLFDWTKPKRVVRWIGFVLVAALLSQGIYSILRLSPLFHMIAQKDTVFVYTFAEWIVSPTQHLEGNLRGLFDWLIRYLTWPIFFAAIAPAMERKNRREFLVLYAWCLIPLVGLASFGKVLYPRFVLFLAMPLLVAAATTTVWFYETVRTRVFQVIGTLVLFAPSFIAVYYILFFPLYAPIPQADRGQYINDWPAGWGVREVNAFLLEQSKNQHITVVTEGTFGLLPYAIEMYVVNNPNITITGIWPLPTQIPEHVAEAIAREPTYLVVNKDEVSVEWHAVLIAQYQKGLRKDRFLRLYRL